MVDAATDTIVPHNVDPGDTERISQSVREGYDALRNFREKREAMNRERVGMHYGENTTEDRRPVNVIELITNIFMRTLVPSRPRIMITSDHTILKPNAASLQAAVNQDIKRIELEKTLRLFVLDALFGMGIVKVGLWSKNTVNVAGEDLAVGETYADTVSLDNWAHDPNARHRDELTYAGHKYRIPLDDVLNNGMLLEEGRLALEPRFAEQTGDNQGTQTISRSVYSINKLVPMVDLWDVYLPYQGYIVTYADMSPQKPLRVQRWKGPDGGPFIYLGFGEVPDNVMPLSPELAAMDLHLIINDLWVKLLRQAKVEKTFLVGPKESAEDMKNLLEMPDIHALTAVDPQAILQRTVGGANPQTLAVVLKAKDTLFEIMGNLQALGGLGPQSQTLGQDELLSQTASQRIVDMQTRSNEAIEKILRQIAWYRWDDPLSRVPIVKTAMGMQIPSEYSPDLRAGDFMQYNCRLDVYSLPQRTPQTVLAGLMQYLQTVAIPFAQQMAEQGQTIDVVRLTEIFSENQDLPELREIITSAKTPAVPSADVATQNPSMTTRKYVRENRRGAMTNSGADTVLAQALMGKRTDPNMSMTGDGNG